MINKPFFSIITCTYNSQKYLQDCIDSIKKQNYRNWEHIFIDAYSKDKTIKLIKAYKKTNYSKVRLYQYSKEGIAKAMNLGIKKAKAKFICHLHSDDYFYSSKTLSLVKKKIENHPKRNIVIGDAYFKTDKKLESVFPANKLHKFIHHQFITSYLWFSNKIPHPSIFINKSIFKRWGKFDESYKIVMDYEYWLRVLKHEKVVFIDRFLSVYRVHNKTTSNVNKKIVKPEIERLINRYKKKYFWERIMAVFLRYLLGR